MKLATGQYLCGEICDALGLKHCSSLDIRIATTEFVTVTAKFNPEIDGVKQFPAILKKFRLVEISEEKKET